jgi:hypothetical protein
MSTSVEICERFEALFDAFEKRFPTYRLSLADFEYLAKTARETEIDVNQFSEWLAEHEGVETLLSRGGYFLLIECFDDHFPIWNGTNISE